MNDSIRCFIGIPLDNAHQNVIKNVQQNLSVITCPIKWVRPEIAHITLKFLGDVSPEQIESINESIKKATHGLKDFSFTLASLDAFPDRKKPSVLWLGVEDNNKNIKHLAGKIEECLDNIGLKREPRPFHAHITIGRIKKLKNSEKITTFLDHYRINDNNRQVVKRIILFKSVLQSQGPEYSILKEFNFNQNG